MASSSTDFTLYPYEWNQDQTYLPTTTFADPTYLNATSFDTYQSQQAYNQALAEQYSFSNEQQTHNTKNNLQAGSPNYSPSNSASHSFDYQQPPVLSSTSDSGASVPSTISSAMGSPSVHAQQSNDWSQQPNLNMLPNIVHHDSLAQDMFASTGFGMETIPATDKGCVGEFTTLSSSQPTQTVSPISMTNFPSAYEFAQGSAIMPQITAMENWSLPAADVPANLAAQPAQYTSSGSESNSPNDSLFKYPTTPASSTPPSHPRSPVLERVKGQRRASAVLSSKRVRGVSPLTQSMSYDESELPPRPKAPRQMLSSPFFTQSSGNFVPPLESSCPSPASTFFNFS